MVYIHTQGVYWVSGIFIGGLERLGGKSPSKNTAPTGIPARYREGGGAKRLKKQKTKEPYINTLSTQTLYKK